MWRIVNCIALIVGLLGVAGGLVMLKSVPIVAYFVIGIGALILTFSVISDQRFAKKTSSERKEITRQRVSELTQKPWAQNQSLKVPGSGFFLLTASILISLVCATAVYANLTTDVHNWVILVGSSVFLPFFVLMIFRSFACLGKPSCELDRDGIKTPLCGKIAWKDIDGVHLQTMDYRGSKSFYLILRVCNTPHVLKDIHWSEHILSLVGLGVIARRVISVQLAFQGETPETIAAVATFLWRQASGLVHDWNPMLSQTHNEAAKRVAEVMAKHSSSEAIQAFISSNPEAALAEARQLSSDIETIRKERLKQSCQLKWAIGFSCVMALLVVIWPLLKHLA